MRKLIIILLISFSNALPAQVNEGRLDSLVTKLGNGFLQNKPSFGLSIGVNSNGRNYFYDFGTTGKQAVPTAQTMYEIGSVTKTFISYILANAVIEQRVKLSDDIRKYIKGSYPNLEYNGNPIRLVNLANTTSLLPDWLPELPEIMKNMPADSALELKIKLYKPLARQDFFKELHKIKLDTIPGSVRKHSNAAAQLLAYILEDLYRMPMEELIKKYITGPCKMHNTGFINSNKNKQLAEGHTGNGKAATYEFEMPYFKNAGGLVSTTADLNSYVKMLMDTTNPASLLCLKKTADINASSGKVEVLQADSRVDPGIYSVGLAWFMYRPEANRLQIWADGGTNGFNSYVVLYPYKKTAVVLLANRSDEKTFRALPGIAYAIAELPQN